MSAEVTSRAKPLVWRAVETAPRFPTKDYLAIDPLGYIRTTRHNRETLMLAGWADGWHPMESEPTPDDGLDPRDGGMKIAAMHAREFKRLLTDHRMPVDTVIEGVKIVRGSPPDQRIIGAIIDLVDQFSICGLEPPQAIVVAEGQATRIESMLRDSPQMLVEDKRCTELRIYNVPIRERIIS